MKRAVVLIGLGAVVGAACTVAPVVQGRAPRPDAAIPVDADNSASVTTTPAEAPEDVPITTPVPNPSSYDPMRSFAPLVDAVSPAVLAIETEGSSAPSADLTQIPPEFRRFFDPNGLQPTPRHGEGSGFVISAEGLVLTNHHVIDNAATITARFADGHTAPATLLGSDAQLDIALLKLEGEGPWPFVELGTSADVKVGDWVVAVGNPLGLGTTVTAGIISGKSRVLGHDVYDDFLQTDAAINPGNSGGPLFGLDGKVLGINTAILNGANTVGFAIPIDMVERVIDDLESKGHVARGFIGVKPIPSPDGKGALIGVVFDDTPASLAGLKAGDVIRKIDETFVSNPVELVRTIGTRGPGDHVTLEVDRDGQTLLLPVELAERPAEETPPAPSLGVTLGTLSEASARAVGLRYGVVVEDVVAGSSADGRLRKGDVIVSVNQWPVASPEHVTELVARSRANALVEVVRDGKVVVVNIPLR